MMFDRFMNRNRTPQATDPSATPAASQGASAGLAADGSGATTESPALEGAAPPPRFSLGDVVRHRIFPFRGVVFDVDPQFANSEEWWQSIPEAIRPSKNQPFYHLLAENNEGSYVAYVSQQNLLPDETGQPVNHPAVSEMFEGFDGERYTLQRRHAN